MYVFALLLHFGVVISFSVSPTNTHTAKDFEDCTRAAKGVQDFADSTSPGVFEAFCIRADAPPEIGKPLKGVERAN
tara:strand:- start:488 stop:715 length:228 start_codon:yes stop_codon:yes gene_type:complete